jgi:hypothetical protein
MNYPFNIYGIKDFIYDKIKKPYWNIQLLFKGRFPYVPWDIVNSSIDILFLQFKEYYEKHSGRYSEEHIQLYYKDKYTPKKIADERAKECKEIRNIFLYITLSRHLNKMNFEHIQEEMFKDSKHRWTPYFEKEENKKLYEFAYIIEPKTFTVKWKFIEAGLAEVTYKETKKKKDMSIYNFERALYNLDNEYAKKIIDYRGGLWD